MNPDHRLAARSSSPRSGLLPAILFACLLGAPFGGTTASGEVSFAGRLFCVDALGNSTEATYDCSLQGQRFALKSRTGELLLFRSEDPRAGIFSDPRVWSHEFEVTGRRVGSNEVEIIHLHALEQGRLIRLYYRCDVCNIDAFAPGPCWCCQQEFEFREVPVDEPPKTFPGRE